MVQQVFMSLGLAIRSFSVALAEIVTQVCRRASLLFVPTRAVEEDLLGRELADCRPSHTQTQHRFLFLAVAFMASGTCGKRPAGPHADGLLLSGVCGVW